MIDLVGTALEQAGSFPLLPPWQVEAWASDLVGLACELGGDAAAGKMVEALVSDGGSAAAVAVAAVAAVSPDLVDGIGGPERLGPLPDWCSGLGTAVAEAASSVLSHDARSIVFRFVDADGRRHVMAVDLVPGPEGERLGEVHLADGDLVERAADEDPGIEVVDLPLAEAARRVAAALASTDRPRPSAAAHGHLLVARLADLIDDSPPAPVHPAAAVPEPPVRDPEDDAHALGVLERAVPARGLDAPVEEAAGVAARLREAVGSGDPLAAWLAGGDDPVDLDGSDESLVIAAVAATVAPRTLVSFDEDFRSAVSSLEPADWLGAIIGLLREGAGASLDPDGLVDRVNRCPEVTTSIPRRDRESVAWAFAVATSAWLDLGIADGEGRLTDLGAAVLPAALARAWSASAPHLGAGGIA